MIFIKNKISITIYMILKCLSNSIYSTLPVQYDRCKIFYLIRSYKKPFQNLIDILI